MNRDIDSETISFLIKQSKTDQARKGHFIYIFNLPSSIQPYALFLHTSNLETPKQSPLLNPYFLTIPTNQ